jgi:hypothetical protein
MLFFLMATGLNAQLDTRLQVGKTDFLNLYQQSTTAKAKPEIVTIFDFSASMVPVMYHPLYRNLRPTDDLTYANIEITFLEAVNANSITNVKLYLPLTVTLNNSTQLTLTCLGLVKPDGDLVTATDAENCEGLVATTGDIIVQDARGTNMYTRAYSNSSKPRDIRHWIMAASHIRLKVEAAQGNVSYALGRTVDVPLPWKVMDHNSKGNPLSSKTIIDRQVKKTFDEQGKPKDEIYGSELPVEFDLTYKIPPGISTDIKFHTFGESSRYTASTNSVSFMCYHIPYLHWLFAGRYQSTVDAPKSDLTDSTANYYITGSGATDNNGAFYVSPTSGLAGKFIIFDSGTDSTKWAAGQTSSDWGKGFKGQTITNKIKVPKYNYNETYKGTVDDYAYKYVIPAVTRVQATKVAVIETWVKNQADVYWVYRFLDDDYQINKTEYTGDNNFKRIDNNSKLSSTTINQSTLRAATNGIATASTLHGASNISSGDRYTTNRLLGLDSGWVVFNNTINEGKNAQNGNSVKNMKRLAATFHNGSTPLTYAMARTLAQYNDLNNVFNDVMRPEDVSECSNSFLILLSDGNDNRGTPTNKSPYLNDAGTDFDAVWGNNKIIGNKASIETDYFNLFTFAALGAHMSNKALGEGNFMSANKAEHSTIKKDIRSYLPFAITERKGIVYKNPKRVTTMTVGVSLGGRYTDTKASVNPKRAMFFGAVLGDPDITSGTISDYRPFEPPSFHPDGSLENYNDWELDPVNPGWPDMGKRAKGAAYFFDATDADKLADSLQAAFRAAISKGSNNATSTPNLPYVGASLAGQVYMGSFAVPDGGGVIWTGDLRMFGTKEEGGSVKILDRYGNATSDMSAENAFWATSNALRDKNNADTPGVKDTNKWYERNLYTRIPGGAELKKFTDRGDDFDNANTGLKKFVDEKFVDGKVTAKTTQEEKDTAKTIQFASGGDTVRGVYEDGRPKTNRDSIMGDIINSSPTTIEYAWDVVKGKLTSHLAGVSGNNQQFRLILVGTNQGWLHAFGEVITKDSQGKVQNAHVEELWAFMPTDFLSNLNYITKGGSLHRFMVDGTPSIYHLDIPSKKDGMANGIVDYMENGQVERTLAIFGLGKGGRSYYALNIEDPFHPKLQWSLVPDEALNSSGQPQFPADRIEAGSIANATKVSNILSKFGFSTGTPAFGRIVFEGAAGRQLKDAVFIGGGFSVPEVDDKFSTKLGRSVMALDAYSGKVLAAEDLSEVPTHGANVGPVGTSLIPFEFIVNSGAAQRVYFTDYKGGLWAWGSLNLYQGDPKLMNDPLKNYRVDTSDLKDWGLRKVAQDNTGYRNARYTTAPAPFLVGNFTGKAKGNSTNPAAVGIAMVSGDRNNPLDYYGPDDYYEPGRDKPIPGGHKLTVVFDRQDSSLWSTNIGNNGVITEDALLYLNSENSVANPGINAGNFCSDKVFKLITPGCDDYYLAPKENTQTNFGYYVHFLGGGDFRPKGINSPVVVSGSLFYSIFNPQSADPCTGGLGTSQSWVIADVLNPLTKDNRVALFASGMLGEWGGVASDFIQVGTRGVLQGGTPLGSTDRKSVV